MKHFCEVNDISYSSICEVIKANRPCYNSMITNITYRFDYTKDIIEVTSDD